MATVVFAAGTVAGRSSFSAATSCCWHALGSGTSAGYHLAALRMEQFQHAEMFEFPQPLFHRYLQQPPRPLQVQMHFQGQHRSQGMGLGVVFGADKSRTKLQISGLERARIAFHESQVFIEGVTKGFLTCS
jgi:hypothetical protein